MRKIISLAIIALLSITTTTYANAALQNKTVTTPSIAILDTAIDTSLPALSGKVIHEVCILERQSCPNGGTYQEGPGSASMPEQFIARNGFDHGTQMAWVAINNNPNMNIVFVRIIGNNPSGSRQVATETTLISALQWVIENKEKWNIQAVSMSQGHHRLLSVVDYCPKTPITEGKIIKLQSMGVPVFLPAGNNRDLNKLDWPACIPSAIAVGATMPAKTIAPYSNYDSNLIDFFALGTMRGKTVGNRDVNLAGTSASAQVAASSWVAVKSIRPDLSYQQVYDLLSRTSDNTYNSKISSGRLINLDRALNG